MTVSEQADGTALRVVMDAVLQQIANCLRNQPCITFYDGRAKAGEIVAAARQKGKAVLNKVSEFLGIRKKLQRAK